MARKIVDLRSDTITKPTPAMRRAMADAEVGDDVFRDDPTVIALEARTADILGKEAALFVPSGTMANQLAIRTHTQAGDEVMLEANAHMYWYEAGASAALSGVICRLLPGVRGVLSAEDVPAAIRPGNVHHAPAGLLAVENTHNRGGGTVWTLEQVSSVCAAAREAGLRTHLDGARLWNASVATGVPEAAYAGQFDSVSVCFSKGLGAPVGSALAGPAAFVERARRFRKQFGGGMRQAGIIAAGALYAIENHRERLAEDHANARLLAEGLRDVPGLQVQEGEVATNMVYFTAGAMPAADFAQALQKEGVFLLVTSPTSIRAVTSLAVDAEDVRRVVEEARAAISA